MALKAILAALEGVDEAVKSLYRPGTKEEGLEGKFVLDVEGVDGFELDNSAVLKTALSEERGHKARLEGLLAPFKDMDPNDVKGKLAKLDKLLKDAPTDEKVQAKIDAIVKQHQEELAAANSRAENLHKTLKDRTRDAAVDAALAGAKALNPEALRLKLQSHIQVKENGDEFSVEIVDQKGNPIVDNRGQSVSVEDYLGSLRKDPSWATSFEPVGKGGSGAEGSSNHTNGKTMTRGAFDALDPVAKAESVKNGIVVVDG